MRALIAFLLIVVAVGAHGSLVTTFDQRGLTSLSYNSVTLMDLSQNIGDQFYVGTYILGGVNYWGGSGQTVTWNSATKVLTWSWAWGHLTSTFVTTATTFGINFKINNNSSKILTAIDIYAFGLLFPVIPIEFGSQYNPQFHNNLDGPSPIPADYGTGMVILVNNDAKQLYLGYEPTGPAGHYLLRTGTYTDSSLSFLGSTLPVNRSVAAKSSDSFGFQMRFTASGSNYLPLVGDVLLAYNKSNPQTLVWTDRRPIGQLFISNPTSTPIANTTSNPRGYTFQSNTNIQTPQGIASFHAAALAYANNSLSILKNMGAQGVIVWDLEGQQYPQPDTSYVGDPSMLSLMAPEMDGIADAFFKTFTSAGIRCGVTIRPQKLNFAVNPPFQTQYPGQETSIMLQKMKYAHTRWGCTIFYVDSNGGPSDATDPADFKSVLASLPSALIIPENIWPKYYAYTAPLASYLATYKPLHTTADTKATWKGAFSLTYVGDAPGSTLNATAQQWNDYVHAVKNGDILSFRAWFDDEPLNSQVAQIYKQAGVTL